MVWRVAHVYHQRPGAREIVHLYANVGATAFIAGELEDLDISDHIQPVVSGVFGSVAGSVPGLQTASNVFVTSVLGGATNAFLTLRVAMITKQYCAPLTSQPRRSLRRAAVVQAGGMLGGIVRSGAPPRLAGTAHRLRSDRQRHRAASGTPRPRGGPGAGGSSGADEELMPAVEPYPSVFQNATPPACLPISTTPTRSAVGTW